MRIECWHWSCSRSGIGIPHTLAHVLPWQSIAHGGEFLKGRLIHNFTLFSVTHKLLGLKKQINMAIRENKPIVNAKEINGLETPFSHLKLKYCRNFLTRSHATFFIFAIFKILFWGFFAFFFFLLLRLVPLNLDVDQTPLWVHRRGYELYLGFSCLLLLVAPCASPGLQFMVSSLVGACPLDFGCWSKSPLCVHRRRYGLYLGFSLLLLLVAPCASPGLKFMV